MPKYPQLSLKIWNIINIMEDPCLLFLHSVLFLLFTPFSQIHHYLTIGVFKSLKESQRKAIRTLIILCLELGLSLDFLLFPYWEACWNLTNRRSSYFLFLILLWYQRVRKEGRCEEITSKKSRLDGKVGR